MMQTVGESNSRMACSPFTKSVRDSAEQNGDHHADHPSYLDTDWDAVLEICILAFTPVHESFERLLGGDLFALVYPDWKTSNKDYLSPLANSDARDRLLVAEQDGSAVGFIHYEVDSTKQRGTIGINAVHPAHQSKGIGSLMYGHVLQIMRAQG
jgi:GNAT superfamily N-acetyltransferase